MNSGISNYGMVQQFEEFYNITLEELNNVIREALNSSAKILKENTTKTIASVFPNAMSSSGLHGDKYVDRFTIPLVNAVRIKGAKMDYKTPFSVVHVLGSKKNDGTYRLRFFENDNSKQRGLHFFSTANLASTGQINSNIASVLDTLASRINK